MNNIYPHYTFFEFILLSRYLPLFQVGNNIIPAHQYILACRSEYFRKLFTERKEEPLTGDKLKITIENMKYDMFMQMIKYVYTDTCDVLTIDSEVYVDGDGQKCKDWKKYGYP